MMPKPADLRERRPKLAAVQLGSPTVAVIPFTSRRFAGMDSAAATLAGGTGGDGKDSFSRAFPDTAPQAAGDL